MNTYKEKEEYLVDIDITNRLLAVKKGDYCIIVSCFPQTDTFPTASLLAGYCLIVSCQLTNMQLSLIKGTIRKHQKASRILGKSDYRHWILSPLLSIAFPQEI